MRASGAAKSSGASGLSRDEFFEQYYFQNRPVIITVRIRLRGRRARNGVSITFASAAEIAKSKCSLAANRIRTTKSINRT
jgi:hypothetical protein